MITIVVAIGFLFSGLGVQHEALLRRQMKFVALRRHCADETRVQEPLIGSARLVVLLFHTGAMPFFRLAASYSVGRSSYTDPAAHITD